MRKYIPKQFFGFFCAIICAFSLAIPGYAVELPDPDTDISFYMENISDAQCVLSIRNGKAAARVSVNGNRGAERSKIILEIQNSGEVNGSLLSLGVWRKMDGMHLSANQ